MTNSKDSNNAFVSIPEFLEKLTNSAQSSFSDKVGQPINLEDNSFGSKVLNKVYQENLKGVSRSGYGQCSHAQGSFTKCN